MTCIYRVSAAIFKNNNQANSMLKVSGWAGATHPPFEHFIHSA